MRVSRGITQDAEFEELGRRGYTGNLNDRQYKLLGNMGLRGALTDRIGSSSISAYALAAVDNKLPPLVMDFKEEDYFSNNTIGSFAEVAEHSRAGNATMTDSSGNIVWAPHNLLTYSEDLASGGQAYGTGVISDNDFTFTASSDYFRMGSTMTVPSKGKYTGKVTISGGEVGDTFALELVDDADGSDSNTTIVTIDGVTTEWTVEADFSGSSTFSGSLGFYINRSSASRSVTAGSTITVNYMHVYRSDLGGMADVPAAERVLPDATTYVRTAGRVIGSELVTNGTFDTDTDWTKGTGWTISGGVASSDGTQVVVSDLEQPISFVNGSVYAITLTVTRSAGVLYPKIGDTTGSGISSSGTFTQYIVAGSGPNLEIRADSNFVGSVDNISVKEIDVDPSTARYLPRIGHHVYNGSQWVNEGLLHESEARTNLVTYSEDFTDASWAASNSSVALDATGPDGLTSAYTMSNTATASAQINYQNVNVSSGNNVVSFFAKAGLVDFCTLRTSSFDAAGDGLTSFDLSDGSVFSEDANHTATIEDCGNGWYRVAVMFNTVTDVTGNVHIYMNADGGSVFDPDLGSNGTSSILIYGAQVEVGSTPSSYIPTNGSSATRPAESITIPAANLPWPEPVYVTNTELNTGATTVGSDWTDNGDGSFTCDGSQIGNLVRFDKTGIEIGKVYKLTATVSTPSAGSVKVKLNGGNQKVLASGQTTTVYLADASGDGFQLVETSGFDGTVSNISVKEINPLALSIQMKGEMTYADKGTTQDGLLLQWIIDSNNRIYWGVDGSSTYSGRFTPAQVDGGTYYFSNGESGDIEEGVNSPFNFAARHGSTFIQGAVDGVALTENTDPVALPDLSSSDMTLGQTFMGTISLFRIWANDLGDTGIEEASEPSTQATLFLSFDGFDHTSYIDFDWSE